MSGPGADTRKRGHAAGQPELDHIARLAEVNVIRNGARRRRPAHGLCFPSVRAVGTVKFRVVPPGEH
jgi:hypothetical protein